ncbi:MAG: hypothetical protein ACPF9D_08205 [Owenweeksia sp.]
MIRAGSLTYAVFVSTVTAVLCMLMIMLAAMNRNFFIHTDSFDKVRDNAHSGIMLGMALPGHENYEAWHELYEPGSDSVKVKKRKWGLFDVISSEAVIGQARFARAAITGYWSPEISTTALWLADRNRPLQLSGNALLKGEFFLPQKGVDRAYVEGANYSREKLFYGSYKTSKSDLPELEKDLTKSWRSYLKGDVTEADSILDFSGLPQTLVHPFSSRTALYQQNEAVKLGAYSLRGNIIIRSRTQISVSAATKLDQVVLIAPAISIEEGFKGSAHLIASDSLSVAKDAKLQYPSSVFMVLEEHDKGPMLKLATGSSVAGAIISLSAENRRTNDLAVEVSEGATFKGILYTNGNLEIGGKVAGTVITRSFLLSTPSGIYENHILNGQIDRTELEKEYLGIPIKDWDNKTDVATWLSY